MTRTAERRPSQHLLFDNDATRLKAQAVKEDGTGGDDASWKLTTRAKRLEESKRRAVSACDEHR
jgi:hypothetical protein